MHRCATFILLSLAHLPVPALAQHTHAEADTGAAAMIGNGYSAINGEALQMQYKGIKSQAHTMRLAMSPAAQPAAAGSWVERSRPCSPKDPAVPGNCSHLDILRITVSAKHDTADIELALLPMTMVRGEGDSMIRLPASKEVLGDSAKLMKVFLESPDIHLAGRCWSWELTDKPRCKRRE